MGKFVRVDKNDKMCAHQIHLPAFSTKRKPGPIWGPGQRVNNYVVAIQWMYALEKAATIPTLSLRTSAHTGVAISWWLFLRFIILGLHEVG